MLLQLVIFIKWNQLKIHTYLKIQIEFILHLNKYLGQITLKSSHW